MAERTELNDAPYTDRAVRVRRDCTPPSGVIGYVRVSTEDQAESGLGLDAQRRSITHYAELYGVEVVEFIEDAGVSGKTVNRPGLQRALERLSRREATGLIVAKLDRLTRSVRDLGALIDAHFGADGARLLSVGEQVDTHSAGGRLVLNVLASVSQWEREAIAERTRAALRAKAARGGVVGSAPLGFQRDGDLCVPNLGEAHAVEVIRTLRDRGVSVRKIADHLNERLDLYPARGSRWHPTSVARTLRRLAAS